MSVLDQAKKIVKNPNGYTQDSVDVANALLELSGEVQNITVLNGAKFVITTKEFLTAEQHEDVKKCWQKFMPGTQLLILAGGFELTVLNPEK